MKTNQEGPLATDVIHSDKYAGKGGSFVFDEATGQRVPSAETAAQLAESEHQEEAAVTYE